MIWSSGVSRNRARWWSQIDHTTLISCGSWSFPKDRQRQPTDPTSIRTSHCGSWFRSSSIYPAGCLAWLTFGGFLWGPGFRVLPQVQTAIRLQAVDSAGRIGGAVETAIVMGTRHGPAVDTILNPFGCGTMSGASALDLAAWKDE